MCVPCIYTACTNKEVQYVCMVCIEVNGSCGKSLVQTRAPGFRHYHKHVHTKPWMIQAQWLSTHGTLYDRQRPRKLKTFNKKKGQNTSC